MNIVEVSPNPHRPHPAEELGHFRFGRATADGVRVYGALSPVAQDGRGASGETPVVSWFRIGRAAAPLTLFEALPQYWLSRFRYRAPGKELRTAVTPTFDPAAVLAKRQPQRDTLLQHGFSLNQKAWAIRYHRGNLLGALDRAKADPADRYSLTVVAAEYAAFGNCLYSILEELAATLACLRAIQGLQLTPNSFHKLHAGASGLSDELGRVLKSATWYESFRLERANTTHAFVTLAMATEGADDLHLWHHRDPLIYSGSHHVAEQAREAASHVAALVSGSDTLIEDLCAYMLGMFHPWDLVTLVHANPTTPDKVERTVVWVREISFSQEPSEEIHGWVLLDKNGVVQITTDERGAMVAPREAG